MSPQSDHPSVPAFDDLDERTIEALLSGRAVEGEPELSSFVQQFHALADAPAPRPSTALAALLEDGLLPSPRRVPLVLDREPRSALARPRFWVPQLAMGSVACFSLVVAAAAGNQLPAPAQSAVASVVDAVTPLTLPRPAPRPVPAPLAATPSAEASASAKASARARASARASAAATQARPATVAAPPAGKPVPRTPTAAEQEAQARRDEQAKIDMDCEQPKPEHETKTQKHDREDQQEQCEREQKAAKKAQEQREEDEKKQAKAEQERQEEQDKQERRSMARPHNSSVLGSDETARLVTLASQGKAKADRADRLKQGRQGHGKKAGKATQWLGKTGHGQHDRSYQV